MNLYIIVGIVGNVMWLGLWWLSRRNNQRAQELLDQVEHYSAHATHMYDQAAATYEQAAAQRRTTSELLNRILSYREGDNNHE